LNAVNELFVTVADAMAIDAAVAAVVVVAAAAVAATAATMMKHQIT
jgi:hypothetical protein